ncbi:MAG: lytic transglycosylase domain-containing protein [Lysobacteraceae bacterium]
MRRTNHVLLIFPMLLVCVASAQARTVYRCMRDGTVSLATAPEPGSRCTPQHIDDDAARLPNLWGVNGKQSGVLYERDQDGVTVYSTRNLPGSTRLMAFTVTPPPNATAHPGLGSLGPPQPAAYSAIFHAAARANGIEDAWLRAIAHAESGMQPKALSPKGAQGIMQLLPKVTLEYRVQDPFSPTQSIKGGAHYLGDLLRRYKGDRRLAAAAYNAGIGTVQRYNGIPPYAETQSYVDKVEALYVLYKQALRTVPAVHRTQR